MAWGGMGWHGMGWHGVAWHGVAWLGMWQAFSIYNENLGVEDMSIEEIYKCVEVSGTYSSP